MGRWTEQETKLLAILRQRLGDQLLKRPQHPDVVGDRTLIRFIREHNFKVDKATEMVKNFYLWRDKNNIDDIRRDILTGGAYHPFKVSEWRKDFGISTTVCHSAICP